MWRRKNWTRCARFESLEGRQLLAGDVVVNVVRGNLVIEGDGAGNEIMVTSGAEAGSFIVTGFGGTTVHENGEPPASEVTVTGVRGDVRINLGEGADVLRVADATIRGDLSIRAGEGNDQVTIGTPGDALADQLPDEVSVTVRGSVRVGTDDGEDEVFLDDVAVRGGITIETGDESDSVKLGSDSTAAGVSVGTGNGELPGSVKSGHSIHVDLGAGNDTLSLQRVTTRGSIVANGGTEDDAVTANETSSWGFLTFGGDGIDALTFTSIDAHHFGVHSGDGDDEVEVQDSVFTTFGVALGAGDDELSTGNLQAKFAVMLGGDGEDSLNELAENEFMFDLVRGFEIPPDVHVNNFPPRRRFGRLR